MGTTRQVGAKAHQMNGDYFGRRDAIASLLAPSEVLSTSGISVVHVVDCFAVVWN
jgi:hypothetical protein